MRGRRLVRSLERPEGRSSSSCQAEETKLKDEYKNKLQQAINLDELRKQREQVSQYVLTLEKQLPSKSEMDALLSDINQAGVGRGLDFELFRPGQTNVREYYAELPITVKVSGKYHDLGAFASDIANLPRIVTLNNMNVTTGKGGNLTLDATAKTYRYLDQDETRRAAQGEATCERACQVNLPMTPRRTHGPGRARRRARGLRRRR